MSDSDESGVTYTDISSLFEELSDIGSPRTDDHEHLELPEMLEDPYVEVALQAPPSPDYIPGPEEPEQPPPSPDYVSGPEHDDDEIVAEDRPYAEDASPTAQSPEYVPESDLEAHPEDIDDEDLEEDPVDYPADEEEKEEHPTPVDSVVVASTTADQAPSAKETKPFETDESAATPPPHHAYRMTARISIPTPVPMPAWSDSEVVRLLAMSSPPASPLSPWSSPPPQIPFPPLPPILSPPSPMLSPAPPPSPICSLGYRVAMIRLRAEAASTSHSPPLPPPFILFPTRSDAPSSGTSLLIPISAFTSSPLLQLPSASCREDIPEVTLPPQKRLGIALGPGYEVGESSYAATARPAGGLRGAPVSTDTELDGYMREFETRVRQDTDEIYMRLDDEQTERHLLAGRLNMLFRDRRAHAYTRHLMETEARLSREAWVRSTDASDLVCGEVMSLRTTVLDHETINATSVTNAQLQAMINQGVIASLAARDALRSTNGDDSHNSRTGVRRTERATRECTYTDFLKCQPLPFKGTKGVASLSQWCERMESVFHISNCAVENQVKFATCTLHSVALTGWNTHVKTVGHEASYEMPWKTLMKMMTDKYCPRNEIKKLEMKLWDLKIEKYIGGLPDMIHGSVVASKPKTMQETVEIATELMDKKIRTFAERETAVYTAASGEKKQYGGSKPLCAKCNYHHDGPCALKCRNSNKIGHFTRDCRNMANTNNANNQRGLG
nr:hypothetical protein [Tanacetum cinerariifolium]